MKTDSFALRHLGPRENEVSEMLSIIGVDSLDRLIDNTIPIHIRLEKGLDLPQPMSEYEFSDHIQNLASKNKQYKSYIGLGYHPTILPAVIQRKHIRKSELVYIVYSLSGGDFSREGRSLIKLSNYGSRTNRYGTC